MAWKGKKPEAVWHNCQECGASFKGQKGAKFCSHACRSRAWRKRHGGTLTP